MTSGVERDVHPVPPEPNPSAQDIDGYIQLTVEMAANTSYLQEIREGLRERMQRAPLCDGRSFASNVESAYQEM